ACAVGVFHTAPELGAATFAVASGSDRHKPIAVGAFWRVIAELFSAMFDASSMKLLAVNLPDFS
ncbi:MAG: hypothetical protein ACK55I_21170, partial [bacterium]